MGSPLIDFEALGVPITLRDGRVFVRRPGALTPELRAYLTEHREQIRDELLQRAARVKEHEHEPLVEPPEDRGWWETPGWSLTGWLSELAAAGCTLTWDADAGRARVTPSRGFVPPWVCSDLYQLVHAGVLTRQALETTLVEGGPS